MCGLEQTNLQGTIHRTQISELISWTAFATMSLLLHSSSASIVHFNNHFLLLKYSMNWVVSHTALRAIHDHNRAKSGETVDWSWPHVSVNHNFDPNRIVTDNVWCKTKVFTRYNSLNIHVGKSVSRDHRRPLLKQLSHTEVICVLHSVQYNIHMCTRAVESRHSAIQYNMILHALLQWFRCYINQRLYAQKRNPYPAVTGEPWGVYGVRIFEKIDRAWTVPPNKFMYTCKNR